MSSLRTVRTFLKVGTCSETLCNVLDRAFEHPLKIEEHASMPFAGGIMQHGYQCGMIWGAALAAGAQAFRLFGSGPKAESATILAAQRIVESFRAQNEHINCLEITELDKSSSNMQMIMYFLIKGGTIGCFKMAARYAPVAFREIDAALSGELLEAPSPPVSCAAMLAEKMGVSEMQVVMAAGFAGGIGLSGGACGALGAAIWIIGMDGRKEGEPKVDFKDPRAVEAVDSFLKQTDYKFECSEIVGRKFESVGDHAGHLCGGGCSKILEVLAAS
ncbi:C-GCAxxG-C-C family (seleno)protein [Gemmatimonadota bacterium]